MLALASLPPVLVLSVHNFADKQWMCFLLAGIYLTAAEICLLIKGKKRLLTGVVFAAMILYAGLAMLPWKEKWSSLLVPIGYALLLLYSLPKKAFALNLPMMFPTTPPVLLLPSWKKRKSRNRRAVVTFASSLPWSSSERFASAGTVLPRNRRPPSSCAVFSTRPDTTS